MSKKWGPLQTVDALNAAADHGYRLLVAGGPFWILRLEATPPDTYRYRQLKGSDRLRSVFFAPGLLDWLNLRGFEGYRFVYPGGVVEKAPHPATYEYVFGGVGKKNLPKWSLLAGQGYHFLGLVYVEGVADSLFERGLGAKPAVAGAESWAVEVLAGDAQEVVEHMNELAKRGYRYLGRYIELAGGKDGVSMRRCIKECGGPFEYRHFELKDWVPGEAELNARGREGFRFVTASAQSNPVLERAARSQETPTASSKAKKEVALNKR